MVWVTTDYQFCSLGQGTAHSCSQAFPCIDFSSLKGEQRDTEGAVAFLHRKLTLVRLVIGTSGISLMSTCINPTAGKGLEDGL